MKFILFSPENFKKIPLRKVRGLGYGSELTSADAGSDGYPRGYSNKNSYRPHVRSEAGYDITQTTVVIKTTAESGM